MTRDEAWKLLTEFNHEPFHLHHAEVVEALMRYFAAQEGYADEADFWGVVGLLHDLDFELYPQEHCAKEQQIMQERGIDPHIIHAVVSHRPNFMEALQRTHGFGVRPVRYSFRK